METIEQLLMQNIIKVLYQQGRIDENGYNLACKQIFNTPRFSEEKNGADHQGNGNNA